jgi:hypothetical protein
MINESDLAQEIETGKQAEAIVNHPLFIASLKSLRALTVDKFESLGFDQTLEMQECNVRLNLIEEFESNLLTMINNGSIAFNTLEEIQTHQKAISK